MIFQTRREFAACFLLALAAFSTVSDGAPRRPKILGISHVRILVSDYCEGVAFYSRFENQPRRCTTGEKRTSGIAFANSHGFIGLNTRSPSDQANLLAEVAFWTDDATALRRYLISHGIPVSDDRKTVFKVRDPEGHLISFFERKKSATNIPHGNPSEPRIIHAGFVVRDREAMDRLYKDILGFHVYWHGGMKDDETDWVDMQVPDGTDWIEYMLNVSSNADKKELGVMNHIALGVPDIHAAEQQLLNNGVRLTEKPEIGRDGKWQLNLYDPDDTRVELMEFTPVQKPCCADYTGPHPGPQSASKVPAKP